MGVESTISGGSDRLARIQKALREAPSSAVLLTLATYPAPHDELASWERLEWSDALAHTIDSEMVTAHEEAGVSDSHYVLIFSDENGRSKKRRTFDIRTRKDLNTSDGLDISLKLDGTQPASNALQQNILFAHTRLYVSAMQSQLQAANETIKTLTALLRASEENTQAARNEYHELRELMVELREAQGEMGTQATAELSPAQAKFLELAQQAMPLLLSRFGGST